MWVMCCFDGALDGLSTIRTRLRLRWRLECFSRSCSRSPRNSISCFKGACVVQKPCPLCMSSHVDLVLTDCLNDAFAVSLSGTTCSGSSRHLQSRPLDRLVDVRSKASQQLESEASVALGGVRSERSLYVKMIFFFPPDRVYTPISCLQRKVTVETGCSLSSPPLHPPPPPRSCQSERSPDGVNSPRRFHRLSKDFFFTPATTTFNQPTKVSGFLCRSRGNRGALRGQWSSWTFFSVQKKQRKSQHGLRWGRVYATAGSTSEFVLELFFFFSLRTGIPIVHQMIPKTSSTVSGASMTHEMCAEPRRCFGFFTYTTGSPSTEI